MKLRPKLPPFTRNFYFVTGIIFLIWMLFLDTNDFITQYQLWRNVSKLESEQAYYLEKIEEVKKDRKELLSNQQLLEKFAREKYLMKRKNEDVFVVIEDQ